MLQYFGHQMRIADSLERTLMQKLKAGGEGGNRGRYDYIASPTTGHDFDHTQGDSVGQRSLACCRPWVVNSWTQLSD